MVLTPEPRPELRPKLRPKLRRVVFLTGPTGTGKSALSLALSERLPCEIISVDSVLVYRGMDIGTAKPSFAARDRVQHHLISILEPSEVYSAAAFRKSALALIDEILSDGKLPLLVGGTMFYFHALEYGLDDIPEIDSAVKRELAEAERRHGLASLYEELQRVDATAASRLHANDAQRIKRALGVYRSSGQAMSEFQSLQRHGESGRSSELPFQVLKYGLSFSDRSRLHSNLESRFDGMLEAGLVEEVCRLMLRGDLNREAPSMRAVGYSQVWAYLSGGCSYEEMRAHALNATRQLVKRQLTWMRRMRSIHWREIDRSGMQALAGEIAHAINGV